jgi:hypothetical protein
MTGPSMIRRRLARRGKGKMRSRDYDWTGNGARERQREMRGDPSSPECRDPSHYPARSTRGIPSLAHLPTAFGAL